MQSDHLVEAGICVANPDPSSSGWNCSKNPGDKICDYDPLTDAEYKHCT